MHYFIIFFLISSCSPLLGMQTNKLIEQLHKFFILIKNDNKQPLLHHLQAHSDTQNISIEEFKKHLEELGLPQYHPSVTQADSKLFLKNIRSLNSLPKRKNNPFLPCALIASESPDKDPEKVIYIISVARAKQPKNHLIIGLTNTCPVYAYVTPKDLMESFADWDGSPIQKNTN